MEEFLSFRFLLMIILLISQINTLLACGGLSKNALYIQEHADIIGFSLSLSHIFFGVIFFIVLRLIKKSS